MAVRLRIKTENFKACYAHLDNNRKKVCVLEAGEKIFTYINNIQINKVKMEILTAVALVSSSVK